MNTYKTITVAATAMLLLWLSGWIFNHFNPYAGILIGIATLIIVIYYIIKQYDKKH